MSASSPRSGARLLVDALAAHGVEVAFGVPGESYLAVLDALLDSPIEFVTCRQEGGAAMMAEAVGKLTGRPGVCFVTRGPGATNASAGVHIAQQDSTPMILFVGQVERAFKGREAFQEVDYPAVFGSMAKWAVEIDAAERIPELVARAFRTARQGRPGPVVVALPEDVLAEEAAVPDVPVGAPVETHPGPADMARLGQMLQRAERPFVLLGGSRWSAEATAALARAAEALALPVAVSFRRQMLFLPAHPCFAGDLGISPNPRLRARIKEADLLLMVGGRLGEMPSQGYTLLGVPDPETTLVHVHPGAEELGRVYQPALAIQAAPTAFAPAFETLASALSAVTRDGGPRWTEGTRAAHENYLAWSEAAPAHPGPVQMGEIMRILRERLPADAILCSGAGNYAGWVHRFHRYGGFGTQLAPVSGSMGYGLPAAIAAKRLHPGRTVVAVAGDGCFLMTGQELATAVRHGLAVVVILVDNGIYGTIRMHQERDYPGRVSGTTLANPDFAAYAQAFGAHGERVERTEDFAAAFDRAAGSGRPAIVHVLIDPEAITPTTTISALRSRPR